MKPHVIVVGLLPQQARTVEMEFKERLELTCIKPTKNGRLRPSGAERAYVMVNFVSHSNRADAKRLYASVVNVPGGVSALLTRLREDYPMPP